MKLLWIGGNHPRHLYYVNQLSKKFEMSGAIVQMRENIIPIMQDNMLEVDIKNFTRHFETREKKEREYFGHQKLPDCEILEVTSKTLNAEKTSKWLRDKSPDIVLIFGSDMIKDSLYSSLPQESINLHLGLSPRYRGAATLFWPFYFLEPNLAGSTFHYIISEPDAGEIIHQCVPKLNPKDGIHDVACKTVVSSTEEMIKLLEVKEKDVIWKKFSQKGTGKNFLSSDFRPEHLRIIYNLFNDDIVKHYIDGKICPKRLNLMKQL